MAVGGAVAIVLLLACVNVANLLLARGVARQKELGIRAALGAGRLRLLRQLLTESLLLTVLGAALGTVMAAWAIDALRGTLPEVVLATTPNLHALSMNPRTLGFAAIVSIATGMLFGVIPAVRIGRQDAHAVLRETGRTGAGRGSRRLRAMLVAGEAALSFVLLTATGLMLRSLTNLLQVDVGFNAERVLTFSIALPDYQYPDAESRLAFYTQALERFRALPGVESGAAVNTLPFSTYNRGTGFNVQERPSVTSPRGGRCAWIR